MAAEPAATPAKVRCLDCSHADRWQARCPVDGRPIRAMGAWRTCDVYEDAPSPATRAQQALRRAGLLAHVTVLTDMDGGRVGLRVRAETDPETASRVLLTVDRAMQTGLAG